MARIREYQLDTTLTANDYLLGNDGDNSTIITKRFALDDIKDFVLEGSSVDIVNSVPRGFTVVVNQAGTDVERSTINISHTPVTTSIELVNLVALEEADYSYGSNGMPTIKFENFSRNYYLPAFVGKTFSFTTTTPVPGSDANPTFTATVLSYDGFERDTSGNIIDTFTLSTTAPTTGTRPPIQASNSVTALSSTDGGTIVSTTIATLDVIGDFSAGGDVQLATNDGRVDIGVEATHQSETHIHGTLHFDEPSDGIVFGPPAGTTDMTTTSFTLDTDGNMIIQGSPSTDEPTWNFRDTVNVNFEAVTTTAGIMNTGGITTSGDISSTGNFTNQGSVIVTSGTTMAQTNIAPGAITLTNADGSAGPLIQNIDANNPQANPTATAQLASVQIGTRNFVLPELSAGVAEALPGLTEQLEGSLTPFALGTFFYGTEQSTGALFQGTLFNFTGTLTNIAANVTAFDIDDIGATNRAAFETFRNGRGDFQLFFVQGDYSGPALNSATAGTTVIPTSDNVYEVIAYNTVSHVVTFGKLGTGIINITTREFVVASDEVSLTGIPGETFIDGTHQFVTIDNNNDLSKSPLNIIGSANGARYTDSDETSVALASIEFTGHNADGDSGAVTVDTTGRYTVRGEITQASDLTPTTISPFDYIVLRPTNGGTARSITLGSGTVGDSIKIVNTSTLNADGTDGATTGVWSILPASGEKIMGDTMPLVLNDPTASFELVFSGGDMGWTLIGIN